MTGSYSPNRYLNGHIKRNGRGKMLGQDWRQALRTPHIYRVGNSTLRVQSHFLVFILFIFLMCLIYYGHPVLKSFVCTPPTDLTRCQQHSYNKTYPLTPSIQQFTGVSYPIAIVSDLDTNSKSLEHQNTWQSYLMKGHLVWMPSRNFVSIKWDKEIVTLSSTLGMKGRGMELSELVTFDGRLVTFDDRTGTVYFFEGDKVYPWVILMDGNGKSNKGL